MFALLRGRLPTGLFAQTWFHTSVTTSALTHLLAVVGTALYVLRAAPAAIGLLRSGRPDPSGAPTFGLLFMTGVWWIAYSLEIGRMKVNLPLDSEPPICEGSLRVPVLTTS